MSALLWEKLTHFLYPEYYTYATAHAHKRWHHEFEHATRWVRVDLSHSGYKVPMMLAVNNGGV